MKIALAVFFLIMTANLSYASSRKEVASTICESFTQSGDNQYIYFTRIAFYSDGSADSSTSIDRHNLRSESHDGDGGYQAEVKLQKYDVRSGLTAASGVKGLNEGEQAIVEAMKSRALDSMSKLELSSVRSLVAYRMKNVENGEEEFPLVEAKDASGKTLGIFRGGFGQFKLSPCND